MDAFEKLKLTFRQGNSLIKLIYINVGIFIIINVLDILLKLFKISPEINFADYFKVPSNVSLLLTQFWSVFSYMFLHESLSHIFFNMFSLFWFGRIFLLYFSEKQLVGLYVIGGLVAALTYVSAFNLIPYYAPLVSQSLLLGASGSIMAIIVATAFQSPNMELQLLFIGNVKLKYIAAVAVLTSFFGLTSNNSGGQLAHLGGALAGYIFVVSLHQGTDLSKGVSRILDVFSNLFRPKKLKVKTNPNYRKAKMTDAEFNANKARKMAEIDKILDKIKTSGYESLSTEEKKRLFEQGNKN
ncbi:Rhomboid family protein [Paludibacter propionicigenes WB4]|uniref:Rhomboid family protein n=1 Tax=Paludibacter propionicigenes (strain DSM 17365 / JCM 13257 / WB4) TaxID=694427 RepID=E4T8E4_PALPW|nr:rhomboid family intramembrane serine protease [Paludibacter propionicigenes]ADQ80988.1 Rhomboid family protein [Paludibacter propionicigenes WB4]